ITAVARAAGGGALTDRVALRGRDDEFRELADSFDAMLDRLEAHDAEQRRFAANASHELRTPLAVTRTLLDLARADPARDVDALLARLGDVNARGVAVTEALLLLHRADNRAFAREPVDLSLLAEEAVETLLPLAEKRGVVVESSGRPAYATGSAALLQQLVTNLVHNAIVHNVTGEASGASSVRVTVTHRGRAAVLAVENTGEELPAAVVATLTEPFQRGSERRNDGDADHAGVGLGLALAASIVKAHDGTLTLTPRTGGGLVAEVELP
ncbi:MAG: HAMP domain-containing sensor histidine kinase, partial [Nocardioides sp.]|uniref:sensor histidine kinase n=1 Tax=Nocardioides sp. TaxID=35761 RepID=UPI0039E2746F